MEQIAILRRMAEKWLEAADEVEQPALKRCYRERALTYERLAMDAGGSGHGASARPPAGGQPA